MRGWEERRQAIAQTLDKAGRTRDLIARHGIDCPTVIGAGTGSFEFKVAALAFDSGPPIVCDEPAATYAPPTSTADSPFRPPATGSGSATRSG